MSEQLKKSISMKIVFILCFLPLKSFADNVVNVNFRGNKCVSLLGSVSTGGPTAEVISIGKRVLPAYLPHFEFMKSLENSMSQLYVFTGDNGLIGPRPLFSKRDKGAWVHLDNVPLDFFKTVYLSSKLAGPVRFDYRSQSQSINFEAYTRFEFTNVDMALAEVLMMVTKFEGVFLSSMFLIEKRNIITASTKKERLSSIFEAWYPASEKLREVKRKYVHRLNDRTFDVSNVTLVADFFHELIHDIDQNTNRIKDKDGVFWRLFNKLEKLRVI